MVRLLVPSLLISAALAGCGGSTQSAGTQASPTPHTSPTAGAVTRTPVRPSPTVVLSQSYRAFMTTLCRALRARDAGAVRNLLPYYQYNSGVRYGSLGDGEGRTGDPAIVQTWLSGSTVRCAFFTPDSSGHAVLLTSGWSLPGGWSLIEADTFGGAWKINDFTFGGRSALWAAMTQTSSPVVVYRG